MGGAAHARTLHTDSHTDRTLSLTPLIRCPLLSRTQALEKFNIEKDIAAFIKKEFDKVRAAACMSVSVLVDSRMPSDQLLRVTRSLSPPLITLPHPFFHPQKYNPTWHCIVGRNFGECCCCYCRMRSCSCAKHDMCETH